MLYLAGLPMEVANTFSGHWNDQVCDQLRDLHDPKLLTLY